MRPVFIQVTLMVERSEVDQFDNHLTPEDLIRRVRLDLESAGDTTILECREEKSLTAEWIRTHAPKAPKTVREEHRLLITHLAKVQEEFGIILPGEKIGQSWRYLPERPRGHIDGIDSLEGILIAVDGTIGILVNGKKWSIVHVAHFLPDEPEAWSALGISIDQKIKKPSKLAKELASYE